MLDLLNSGLYAAKCNKMSTSNKAIAKISANLDDDWKILSSIYNLLIDEKAFCVACQDWSEKIVQFVQPDDLKNVINLKVYENSQLSLNDVRQICGDIIKYSVKTSHGRFHNQLYGQMDPYGLAGAWISEALNTSAYTFEIAPIFSLIETEIICKTCELSGYKKGDGIFAPGGSISNMYGLVLARYKRYPDVKCTGMFGLRQLVLFTSEESHYSLKKAAYWLGFGMNNCIAVKTNKHGQMSITDLEFQICKVKTEGKEPLFVNATAGTTVLGAFDDLHKLADLCKKYHLWLHVDACLGGSLLLSYKYRYLLNGLERANSFSWNPHKSLGAPLQCSLFLTCESELLSQSNSLAVNYLFQQDKFYDVSYDTGNKSIQCGRKVDSFKFWLMLKARGYGTFGRLIDHAVDMAKMFVQKLQKRGEENGFRLVLNEFQYSNVCFWYIPQYLRYQKETNEWKKQLNKVAPKIKEHMVHEGTLMLGYCPLQYRDLGNFFRMVFTCFPIMTDAELDFILDEIQRLGEQ